jgi:hypothetical protein
LSSHPDPGNRYESIMNEASRLKINTAAGSSDVAAFNRVRSELKRMPQAPTMAEIEQRAASSAQSGNRYPAESRIDARVDSPSSTYRTYSGNLFSVNVPDNWEQFEGQNSVTFAPRGAYGNYRGQSVFTHGTIAGVVNTGKNNLEEASDMYLGSLLQRNAYLQPQDRYLRTSVGKRRGLTISLAGTSPVTGRSELVNVYTSNLSNGWLFYVINVAPKDDYPQYQRAFNDLVRSITLN